MFLLPYVVLNVILKTEYHQSSLSMFDSFLSTKPVVLKWKLWNLFIILFNTKAIMSFCFLSLIYSKIWIGKKKFYHAKKQMHPHLLLSFSQE